MAHRKMIKMMIKIMIDLNNGDVPYFSRQSRVDQGGEFMFCLISLYEI